MSPLLLFGDNLDWVVDVSGNDKRAFWKVLKGNEPNNLISSFKHAIINTQNKQAFEVYSITVDGVTVKEFAKLFRDDPTNAKLLIKDRGRPLYKQKEAL
jgi:DNA/RNA endonuclease G (NUC1)